MSRSAPEPGENKFSRRGAALVFALPLEAFSTKRAAVMGLMHLYAAAGLLGFVAVTRSNNISRALRRSDHTLAGV